MGLSLLYLVTVKRRLCQMNQPNNYADKNICLKSPTAWGTVPLNVGFHSPRQGEIFQSCIFHLKRSSNGLEFNRLYTASPSAVRIYFWRGWRGELGYFIVTRPFWRAGVREYSRKLGRFFKPTTSIISLTLFSSVPIAMINRFIFFRKRRYCFIKACMGTCMGTCMGVIHITITNQHIAVLQFMMFARHQIPEELCKEWLVGFYTFWRIAVVGTNKGIAEIHFNILVCLFRNIIILDAILDPQNRTKFLLDLSACLYTAANFSCFPLEGIPKGNISKSQSYLCMLLV